jgi:hypothetical protein
MLPPIQTPKYLYIDPYDLTNVPLYSGPLRIEDPCLIKHSGIPWNGPKHDNNVTALTAAPPELGDLLSNKKLGGKLTVLILCYGNYAKMHIKCIDSIIKTVPADKLDLRIAVSCVSEETTAYVARATTTKVYTYVENIGKYAIMRDMLHDTECPIATPYFAWFDDNCYVSHKDWVNQAVKQIIVQSADVAMLGIKLYYRMDNLSNGVAEWLLAQPWHKGKKFRNVRGVPSDEGDCLHFCADWFFIGNTKVFKRCEIPAKSLIQKGDIVIGEQLYQNGYSLKTFNLGKAFVYQLPYRELPRRTVIPFKYPWEAAEVVNDT